jgi:quinol monooxygenase YgiN
MAKHKKRKSALKRIKHKSKSLTAGKAAVRKISKDAFTLLVILRAREGQETLLEAELRALVGPTRKEPGCLIYDLHSGAETPGAFLFHELWTTREAHSAHTKTPHFLRWQARRDSLLASQESTFWKRVI